MLVMLSLHLAVSFPPLCLPFLVLPRAHTGPLIHKVTPVSPTCSLKSANVLLDKKYRAKLADVGLAKTLTHCYGCDSLATYMATGELGTFAWAAPEVTSPPGRCCVPLC